MTIIEIGDNLKKAMIYGGAMVLLAVLAYLLREALVILVMLILFMLASTSDSEKTDKKE